MVGGLRMLRVKQGREVEFERLFRELRQAMRQHEPGCTIYTLMRSRLLPGAYVIHEQYRDQAAISAHQTSPHIAGVLPQLRDLLDRVEVEYYDIVLE